MSRFVFCVVLLLAPLTLVHAAAAQNFRVETDVFREKEKKPDCQTLTLFTDPLVYDFILSGLGDEVTIFDMSAGRVILLNTTQQRKTVLTFEQLIELTTKIKVATTEKEPLFFDAANPQLETEFDESNLMLKMTSKRINYAAKGLKPEQATAVARYQQFADWSARLNASRPGGLPPHARMELSKALADRNVVPEEIVRVTTSPGRLTNKKLELTSRHHFNWTLSESDRKRIAAISEKLGTYEGISFMSFVAPPDTKKR